MSRGSNPSPLQDKKLSVDIETNQGSPVNSEDALTYGSEHETVPPSILSPAEQRALWRKIDLRFMPIVTMMYLCSFLDRSNIGKLFYMTSVAYLLTVTSKAMRNFKAWIISFISPGTDITSLVCVLLLMCRGNNVFIFDVQTLYFVVRTSPTLFRDL